MALIAVEHDVQRLETEGPVHHGTAARPRPMHPAQHGELEQQHIADAQRCAGRIHGGGREAHLLAGQIEPEEHGSGWNREGGLGEPLPGRPEELALHKRSNGYGPRGEDYDDPALPAHDSAAPAIRSAASNASRSSGVSTTIQTSDGKGPCPPYDLRTVAMMA